MFNNKTVLKFFEAFSIQRWNDLIRPFEPVEMDKTAEKAFLAFIIGKYTEKDGHKLNWQEIIEGCLFELFRKIALSDIKSPVQRLIRTMYPDEYKKINEWIFKKYEKIIDNEIFLNSFYNYLFEPSSKDKPERQILQAAHKFSAIRELEMLKPVNEEFRFREISLGLKKDINSFMHLTGVQLLLTEQKPYKFITEIEKLRFQTRWNQTPRVPATSVLGHSYFVAALTLLMCYDLNLSGHRLYNNFFSALFHDLPEAVTRDIISPVKQATGHLPEIVKAIEDKFVKEELLPIIDDFYKDEILFYIQDEFENRIILNGEVKIISNYEEFEKKYSNKEFRPTDGKLVRLADQIAAFVEADSSIRYGITSKQLEEGRKNILSHYPVGTKINNLNTDKFFNDYRQN